MHAHVENLDRTKMHKKAREKMIRNTTPRTNQCQYFAVLQIKDLFNNSFIKYLLSTYNIPGIILMAANAEVNK